MTEANFVSLCEGVYADFGRSCPPQSGPVLSRLWGRVKDIPDEAVTFICDRLSEEDKFPVNMGKAIWASWDAYLSAHPHRRKLTDKPTCRWCNDGWFWCWERPELGSEEYTRFVSPCPSCNRHTGQPTPVLAELKNRGVLVMPPDYPGGPLAFEWDRGLRPRPEPCQTAWNRLVPQVAQVPAYDFTAAF